MALKLILGSKKLGQCHRLGKSSMEYLRENNDFVTEKDGLQKVSTPPPQR